MRHFLQRWHGSFLLSLFMFTSTNVTGGLWLDAGKRRADVLLPYMGTEVDVKLRRTEMFPGNGGIWIANQQGSSAIWQTQRATPTCFHSEPRAQLRTAPITFIALVVFFNISTMVSDDTSAYGAKLAKSLMKILLLWQHRCHLLFSVLLRCLYLKVTCKRVSSISVTA